MPRPKRKPRVLDFQQDFNGSLDQMLGVMPTNFLQCRELSHSWRPANTKLAGKNIEQLLKCTRCMAERTRIVSAANGEPLTASKYTYKTGYRVTGVGRLDRSDNNQIRLASMMRLIGQ